MFLKICTALPIQTIYYERIRVNKLLEKNMLKKKENIKFTNFNNNKLKGICTKQELLLYLKYLDEQLYIYPKIAKLPEIIKDKISY